jgi:hypothetical protein
LFHGFESGWHEQGMSADQFKSVDRAVSRNIGVENYHALNAGLPRQNRINRHNGAGQKLLGDVFRHANAPSGGWFAPVERRWAKRLVGFISPGELF